MSSPSTSHARRRAGTLITDSYGAHVISFQRVATRSLPDNVLLDMVFDFYQKIVYPSLG